MWTKLSLGGKPWPRLMRKRCSGKRNRDIPPGPAIALPEEAKHVLAQSRLQSAEQPWESCSFTLQTSFLLT